MSPGQSKNLVTVCNGGARLMRSAPRKVPTAAGATVQFVPAGGNTMKATGDFIAAKGMKVIVSTDQVGGQSLQARTPSIKCI